MDLLDPQAHNQKNFSGERGIKKFLATFFLLFRRRREIFGKFCTKLAIFSQNFAIFKVGSGADRRRDENFGDFWLKLAIFGRFLPFLRLGAAPIDAAAKILIFFG